LDVEADADLEPLIRQRRSQSMSEIFHTGPITWSTSRHARSAFSFDLVLY